MELGGALSESPRRRGPGPSGALGLPDVVACLNKAAADPRVTGVLLEIKPLACGWAKLGEIRRQIVRFQESSGKFCVSYMEVGGEKEYFLASAAEEMYVPPSAYFTLKGFAVQGTFLRGVLDKVGVEPQVERYGKYKSAGDQLLRRDMSEAQREASTALLDDIYNFWSEQVAQSKGTTPEAMKALLDERPYKIEEELVAGGWVTAARYKSEVKDLLAPRTGGPRKKLRSVSAEKYLSVPAGGAPKSSKATGDGQENADEEAPEGSAEALTEAFVDGDEVVGGWMYRAGKDGAKSKSKEGDRGAAAGGGGGGRRVGIIRASGPIVGGKGQRGQISAPGVIADLKKAARDPSLGAVVLRVDSPGGDALASDLMWQEIRLLGKKIPIVASMSDVAASGGYYMSMGCKHIVAEPLTLTGSIGVVTGKLNLEKLYEKVGYKKEILSRGRLAELDADNRPFTEEEQADFSAAALHAYESFRNKAALSRGMEPEEMEQFAQGRVWTGQSALEHGLVDELGGIDTALDAAARFAGLPTGTGRVRPVELSKTAPPSPLELATGGASTRVAEAFGALVWLANAGARLRSAAALLPTTGEPLALCDVSAGFYGDDLWKPEE